MQSCPAVRPQLGRLYGFSSSVRVSVLIFLPSGCVIVHVVPRSREMNRRVPPKSTVPGLCGDSRIGVFQFQPCTQSSSGPESTLPRPPPPPWPPPPPAPAPAPAPAAPPPPAAP